MKKTLAFVMLAGLLLTGCSKPASAPAAPVVKTTPTATVAPAAKVTPKPTPTPVKITPAPTKAAVAPAVPAAPPAPAYVAPKAPAYVPPAPAPVSGTIICRDGYVWPSTTRQGACSRHGGIRN